MLKNQENPLIKKIGVLTNAPQWYKPAKPRVSYQAAFLNARSIFSRSFIKKGEKPAASALNWS